MFPPPTDNSVPWVSLALFVMMLMTALTAFAPQIVPPGPRDNFDPLDVLKQCVLHLPIHAVTEWRVNAPAVDQYEHRARQAALESAHAESPSVGIDPADLNTRHQSQKLRQACGARPPDVFLGKHVDRG